MAGDSVQHILVRLAVTFGQFGTDLGMPALHLVIGCLADIVQQIRSGELAWPSMPSSSAIMPHRWATSILCCSTFWL